MLKELELWTFVAERLRRGESVMLLVVAESTGSSPGRAGYKMAVGTDGELCGSIGGGVMEVNLVDAARGLLSLSVTGSGSQPRTRLIEQEHRKNADHPSGMICSGRQTVIQKELIPDDLAVIERIVDTVVGDANGHILMISDTSMAVGPYFCGTGDLVEPKVSPITFEKTDETDFMFSQDLGEESELHIVGGGHCALALSELMSKLGFRVLIYDDRPILNTLDKNQFADEITIIDGYDEIGKKIPDGPYIYVAVMTLGYVSDATVIRQLIDHDLKYIGVLGSRAKMATLMKDLRIEGFDEKLLDRIHTPIGLPINSRTPEEIAVSIAAEIILIKNS